MHKKRVHRANSFEHHKIRHPSSLPQSSAWLIETDVAFIRTLEPYEQRWLAAWLDADFGGNPGHLTNCQESKRASWNRQKANQRDVMTILRPADRVSIETLETNAVREAVAQDNPSLLQKRGKVHVDVCQTDDYTNHVEDAMIAILDESMRLNGSVRKPSRVRALKKLG